jgi:hypothetical protein
MILICGFVPSPFRVTFSSSSFRPVSSRLVNGDAVISRVPTVDVPLGRRGLIASLRVGKFLMRMPRIGSGWIRIRLDECSGYSTVCAVPDLPIYNNLH